jgi:hypothetical protein
VCQALFIVGAENTAINQKDGPLEAMVTGTHGNRVYNY